MSHSFVPETWNLSKPAVTGQQGLVASHHYLASEIGANILANGGNAVDAAVAASAAIGAVEPWMSGIGGGGFMLIHQAHENKTYAIDFGMRAPQALNPEDYPLAEGVGTDLFQWPAVVEDRNLLGYSAMAVPGYVAGINAALQRFGSRSWADSLQPAIELARQGMTIDWYATLKITAAARELAQFAESRRVYLPQGFPPVGEWGGPLPRIQLGRLADTLERLASAGAQDFYQGELAQALVADVQAGGGKLSLDDLASYQPRVIEAGQTRYRDAEVYFAPGLTAGPSLARALELLSTQVPAGTPLAADSYRGYADSLLQTYAERLATMGDSDEARQPSCTTHLSVVDKEGNFVAVTQTLLSIFGSRVMLPQTGILMNNGIMWFDPRPGRPNSIAPGKKPLSNMCPTFVKRDDGLHFALGASGGRRIMPAIFQLCSFLIDHRLSVDAAFHQPRLDVSGSDIVTLDAKLPTAVRTQLAQQFKTLDAQHGVYPALFACPNLVSFDHNSGQQTGAAFVPSPWAQVSAA